MLKKRALTISLVVLVCAVMFNIVPMIWGNQNKAVAADSSFDNFNNDYNMSSSDNSKITMNDSKLTIGTGSTSDGRVSTVLTSKNTVDFTRNFTLTGELTDTTAPDGFTITFQPDSTYKYYDESTERYAKEGTALCVYNVEGATRYAGNSLITEVDTYDSYSIGSGNKTDQSDLTDKIKDYDTIGEKDPRVPHLAISTLDSTGTETLRDARLVKAGENGQDGTAGAHNVTVKWEITNPSTGTGTYTVTYDDKTISYADFDPEDTFKTTSPYLTFTGSVDFGNNAQSGNAWDFEIQSFQYNDPANLIVTETSDNTSKYVSGNKKIKYTINIKNTGGDAIGVRVRRYMCLIIPSSIQWTAAVNMAALSRESMRHGLLNRSLQESLLP